MIRVFIGSSSMGEDRVAEAVLRYSLIQNSSEELNIEVMQMSGTNVTLWDGWEKSRWSTPFSGYRWAIAEACGFQGKAIYMDVDQLNLRDISELYNTPMNGKVVLARRGTRFGGHEFCVMLIDCERMKDILTSVARMKTNSEFHHRYIRMFSGNDHLVGDLDPRWNCFDGENLKIDDIWHLHFTKMSTQPWKPSWFTGVPEQHPRQDLVDLWNKYAGYAEREGWIRDLSTYPSGMNYGIIGR